MVDPRFDRDGERSVTETHSVQWTDLEGPGVVEGDSHRHSEFTVIGCRVTDRESRVKVVTPVNTDE